MSIRWSFPFRRRFCRRLQLSSLFLAAIDFLSATDQFLLIQMIDRWMNFKLRYLRKNTIFSFSDFLNNSTSISLMFTARKQEIIIHRQYLAISFVLTFGSISYIIGPICLNPSPFGYIRRWYCDISSCGLIKLFDTGKMISRPARTGATIIRKPL